MPEYPLLDPPRTSDPAATTDEPLAAADRAGGVGIPPWVSNPAAPRDLPVRTPEGAQWRLTEGDTSLSGVVSGGKALRAEGDRREGAQGPRRRTEESSFRRRACRRATLRARG